MLKSLMNTKNLILVAGLFAAVEQCQAPLFGKKTHRSPSKHKKSASPKRAKSPSKKKSSKYSQLQDSSSRVTPTATWGLVDRFADENGHPVAIYSANITVNSAYEIPEHVSSLLIKLSQDTKAQLQGHKKIALAFNIRIANTEERGTYMFKAEDCTVEVAGEALADNTACVNMITQCIMYGVYGK